jgi:hypothetical protein
MMFYQSILIFIAPKELIFLIFLTKTLPIKSEKFRKELFIDRNLYIRLTGSKTLLKVSIIYLVKYSVSIKQNKSLTKCKEL